MKKAKFEKEPCKYATIDEARNRYRLGRNSLMAIATEAGAVVRLPGRIVRINIPVLDAYFEQF